MADDRDSVLDTVRLQFDRTLHSDYRSMDDLTTRAPGLMSSTGFKQR
ncbi:hypothetical protein [Cupriavidus numazuensis]|uniref:Uncharacterized protein n=1 Tax=Cupriavidus numazuensis TaxID=221992 RepID=A0ABM8TMU4_9BURK|nr:hypothetical protein LMG26411_04915 [Cupriavidus numazuensis]